MRRHSLYHATAIVLTCWFAYFVHALAAGPPVAGDMRMGEIKAAPTVQVGLGRCLRETSARIAVRGPYRIVGSDGELGRGDKLDWTTVRAGEGIRLGDETYGESPVTIVPERDGTIEVRYEKTWRGRPTPPTDVRYRGRLIIHALKEGRLALVNEVDLEVYLRGVVGKEMNLLEGVEALKTQVIAARTYAAHEQGLDRLRRVKGEVFDLYDDQRSQVYGGMERETARATRVVDDTRGMFLMYEDRLVRTFYSSACGGFTEPSWEILGDQGPRIPPLAGVECGYCERRSIYRWSEPLVVTKREIEERCLPEELRGAKVRSVEISGRMPGGHAREVILRLENPSRELRLRADHDFRRKVKPRFRSLLWDRIEDRGDSIAIHGRGFGHGAGMCQVGAYEMAEDGKSCMEILEHYFPGAQVRKLY